MTFYFVIITVTILLYYIATILYSKKRIRPLGILFLILTALFPSVIAGLRNESVGTDMQTYVVSFFDIITHTPSLLASFDILGITEYGYITLNYICGAISKDIHFFLFCCEIIKISLVLTVAIQLRKHLNSVLFLATYMLFFWWYGLSLMRQGIAIAICLYAICQYIHGKRIEFFFCIAIAWTFHNSAFIMLLLPFIDYLVEHSLPLWFNFLIMALIITSSTVVLDLLSNYNIISTAVAERYIDSGVVVAKSNLLIAVYSLVYVLLRRERVKKKTFQVVFNCSLYCLFFLMLSSSYEVAFRVSYYPFAVTLIVLPIIINTRKNTDKQKKNVNIKNKCYTPRLTQRFIESFVYVSLFVLHFYLSAMHGLGGTIPYSSSILGL